jgi:hypothetical protein
VKYEFRKSDLPYWRGFDFLWVKEDRGLWQCRYDLISLDKEIFPLVKERRVAIQAGGAMGMFPKRMAQVFDAVYTFEPTSESFNCLAFNCREENIIPFHAALGEKANCIVGEGIVPTIRIDDLGFKACDLLMLDIEGYELFALRGAIETIRKCHPVIVLEDKGCAQLNNFGYPRGAVAKYLEKEAGYTVHSRIHGGRDVILVHEW